MVDGLMDEKTGGEHGSQATLYSNPATGNTERTYSTPQYTSILDYRAQASQKKLEEPTRTYYCTPYSVRQENAGKRVKTLANHCPVSPSRLKSKHMTVMNGGVKKSGGEK